MDQKDVKDIRLRGKNYEMSTHLKQAECEDNQNFRGNDE